MYSSVADESFATEELEKGASKPSQECNRRSWQVILLDFDAFSVSPVQWPMVLTAVEVPFSSSHPLLYTSH